MKHKRVSLTISKTIQARQFEPIVVSWTEEAEVTLDDNMSEVKGKLYESVSKTVSTMMKKEHTKWKKLRSEFNDRNKED